MTPRGRTRIAPRALSAVVAAVAGESLGVSASRIRVDLVDTAGALAVTIRSPLAVPSLQRVARDPESVESFGGTVVDRIDRARADVARRVTELTGSTVGRVAIRIGSAELRQGRRVA